MLRATRALPNARVFLLILVVMSASAAHSQTTAFTYQGQLSDAGALANGSYDLRFALFDTAAGGTQIGANQDVPAVPVSAGVFTVQLDFEVNAFPGANRFVEIGVRPAGGGTFTTLAPRQQISSSPYAIRTLSAATADALSSACVGCVTSAQIQDVAGSKVSGTIPAASLPTGSGNYIQNTTAQQASANFNIAGNGVVGGDLTVAGTLNANVSGNFIQNRTTPQAGANFDVGGNGTVGGVLSAGSVGIGTATPSAGVLLDVNGAARMTGGGRGEMVFGTPNAETGMTLIFPSNAGPLLDPNNRADVRFDGSTLKLVARVGATSGPPGSTNGVAIDTAGNVGIGTISPISKLEVVSTGGGTGVFGSSTTGIALYGKSTQFEGVRGEAADVNHGGVVGVHTGAGIGVFGTSSGAGVQGSSPSGTGVVGSSTSGTGVRGQSAAADITNPGVYGISTGSGGVGVRGDAATGVYGGSTINGGIGVTGESTATGVGVYGTSSSGYALYAAGNTGQARDKGGWAKAMASIDPDGNVIRCYNSTKTGSEASTAPCGIVVFHDSFGIYRVDFGFQVNDRYWSALSYDDGGQTSVNLYQFESCVNATANQLCLRIAHTKDGAETTSASSVIVF